MKSYFPDTNFFFECRKAIDLPWHNLDGSDPGAGPDILLIVPPTVITEIERHKAKGNSRTAKRARDASARLREAYLASDQQAVLREANPRIVLKLPPVFKVDFSQYPDLDRERPDHRIAAEYATMNLPDAAVLTDDTLSALAARSIALATVLIPPDWKLAPERDERDDMIAELQSELKSLKQAAPELALNVLDANDQIVTELRCEIVQYRPSASDIERAVAAVQRRHPIATSFNQQQPSATLLGMGQVWRPATLDAIEDYKARKYPEWVDAVRKKLTQLGPIYDAIACEISFAVSIANNGFVNAEDVRLFIDGFDGIQLLASLDHEELEKRQAKMGLPEPVLAPLGGYHSLYSFMDAQIHNREIVSQFRALDLVPPSHHPNKFYFSSRRPSKIALDHIELGCKAFPHQRDAAKLPFRAYAAEHLGAVPRLRIRVEASNLRKPIEVFVKFEIFETAGDFLSKLSADGAI